MAKSVRFATLGSNFIVDAFLDAGKRVPGFVHAGVYSRTTERAVEYAAKHNISTYWTSLEDLAASSEVDAVYIASPTSEHAKHAILFLNAGKHVLCEKPAVSNAAELEAVLAAAAASGCAFMEGMRPLKTPAYAAARERLADLGPIRHFSINFCQLSSRWPAYVSGERPNAFLPEFSNGALMDLGTYAVYSAVAFLGKPEKVSYKAVMLPTGVDAAGTLVLQYPEAIATIVISKMSHGFNHSEIQTEDGTLRIDSISEYNDVHFRKKNMEPEIVTCASAGPGLKNIQYELADFVAMVQGGRQQDDVLTWELARSVMSVLDKARADAGIEFPADTVTRNAKRHCA